MKQKKKAMILSTSPRFFSSSTVLRTGYGRGKWLQDQASDTFVVEARRRGYIARSAFKLLQLDDKYKLFSRRETRTIIDLGCSPGGWCQIIRERCGDNAAIIGVDLNPMRVQIPNAVFLQGDFTTPKLQSQLLHTLGALETKNPQSRLADDAYENENRSRSSALVDVIVSDMCPNRTGGIEDRYRIHDLNRQAHAFAAHHLRPGGHFVCKVLGSRHVYEELWGDATRHFAHVATFKPHASRIHSDESFLVCQSKLQTARGKHERSSYDVGGAVVHERYSLDDWPGMVRHNPTRRRRPV